MSRLCAGGKKCAHDLCDKLAVSDGKGGYEFCVSHGGYFPEGGQDAQDGTYSEPQDAPRTHSGRTQDAPRTHRTAPARTLYLPIFSNSVLYLVKVCYI